MALLSRNRLSCVMSVVPVITGLDCCSSFEKGMQLDLDQISKVMAEVSYLKIENQKLLNVIQRLLKVESDIYIALSEGGWDRNEKPCPVDYIKSRMKS